MSLLDFFRLYLMWRNEPESLRPLNLYPVWEPDLRFFRSAQPQESDLRWMVKELGLKSVLVLRSNVATWEADLLAELGVEAHHVPMSASREPSPDQVDRLLATASSAATPLLTHCQAGADRTGVWSFLVRHETLGLDQDTSLGALEARYFHLPEVNAETRVLREWARAYERRTG